MKNTLPVNNKEELVYTFFMVIVMAGGMTFYNTALHNGFNFDSMIKAWILFPVVGAIAFAVEWFFVGKTAHYLIHKYIKQDDHVAKQVLLSSLFFVVQMVLIMSVICAVLFNAGTPNFWQELAITIPRNFIMAFPLKVIVAGPLAGTVFRKLFPIGTITVND